MAQSTTKHQTLPNQTRNDLLAGLAGMVLLGSVVFVFQSLMVLVAFLGAIGLALAIVFASDWIPLILLLMLPYSIEFAVTGTTRITLPTEPLIILIVLVAMGKTALSGRIVFRSSPINWGVILLYVVMVASLAITWVPISTLKAIVRDTGYILAGYYLIPLSIQSSKQLQTVLKISFVLHGALVLYGFVTQAISGIGIYHNVAGPFFVEHCIYAAFITMSFAFVLAFFLAEKNEQTRFFLGILAIVIAAGIGLTFVRAAWFSVIALLLFYLFQFRKEKSAVDLLIVLILGTVFIVVILMVTDLGRLFMQRVETVTDLRYVSNYDRLDRWIAAYDMWMDHIIYGVGWGAYPDVYPYYQAFPDAYSAHLRMGAHNLYLEMLAETGLIGMAAFLLLLYLFFRQCIVLQSRITSRPLQVFLIALQGAMITYLIHAFLNNLGPSDKIAIMFWGMLGMVSAVQFIAEKEGHIET